VQYDASIWSVCTITEHEALVGVLLPPSAEMALSFSTPTSTAEHHRLDTLGL
jgi:hypothetical protein